MPNITIPDETIQSKIYVIRGKKVMLDRDLAQLYGIKTHVFNQAVKRKISRFPSDFMFSLLREEILNLSQFVISSKLKHAPNVNVFTEQGVAMLSCVLNSERAVQVNIQIIRTFTRLRELLNSHKELRNKIESMEKKYDRQFAVVFDAIKQLFDPPRKPKKKIGFILEK